MANAISAFSGGFSNKVKFNRKEVLGEEYSTVFRGTYEDKNVAVKRIVLNWGITGDGDNFKAQMKLDHKNVLKILAVDEDLDFRYILLELCSGTLLQVIKKTYNGPALPPDEEVMYQIADGLEYIHSNKLVHRDIKPENILVSMKSEIKLADFGLSKQTESKCYVTGLKGTLLWKAPEQFRANHEEVEIEVAQKSDVFSCGCVFFFYCTRGTIHPFGDTNDHLQIYANIQEGNSINLQTKDNHPPETELIQKMIQRDPVKRITSEDVKNEIGYYWLPKRNSSTIDPLTLQTSLCNQGEKLTVDNEQHGAESRETTYSNRGYEGANCDGDCVSTSFPDIHGILANDQHLANQHGTFPKPAKQRRLSQQGFTQRESVKQPQQKSRLPIMVHYNFQETGEAKWRFIDIRSQHSSCDSNDNNDPHKK